MFYSLMAYHNYVSFSLFAVIIVSASVSVTVLVILLLVGVIAAAFYRIFGKLHMSYTSLTLHCVLSFLLCVLHCSMSFRIMPIIRGIFRWML